MNLTIKIALVSALLCFGFAKGNAQTNKLAFSPTHLQAAESFLISTGIDKQFGDITNTLLSAFGNQIPEDKKATFVSVMKKFMGKYYNWEVLKVELSNVYAAEFSESELKDLAVFYNTSVGKKYGQKLPALTQKGLLIGQKIVSDHQTELQQMMQDAFK